MTKKELLKLLEEHKDERGIKAMARNGVKSFGIGMTKLKALAKKIGKNHALAFDIWGEPYSDTKLLATLIADPAKLTKEEAGILASSPGNWIVSYSLCNNLMPTVPFLLDVSEEWLQSPNAALRRCGYLCLAEICQNNTVLPDEYFEVYIDIIERDLQGEENLVKDAMNNALIAIGSHSKWLNKRAMTAATVIGKVEVDYGDNSCEALDAVKHLTMPKLTEKLGVVV